MPTYEIKVPGAVFKDSMDAMRGQLANLAASSEPIAFDIFFNYFVLAASNESLGVQLRNRGTFRAKGAGAYQNVGPIIAETVHDVGPERRELTLYLGPELDVTYAITGPALDIRFRNGDAILGVDELPEELGFGTSFLLQRILWTAAGARYYAEEDGLADNKLEIFVDASLKETVFLAGLRGLPVRSAAPLWIPINVVEGACCSGFHAKQPPEGPLCVNLHAKLVTTAFVDVDALVLAMNEVFNTRDVTVHLAGVEQLNLPEFRDLEVGRCVSNEVTDEQNRLYRQNRGDAGADDICAFWVDSLTSDQGNVIGCAAHPPGVPSVAVVSSGGTAWLLAHEIGHVLGLWHVSESNTDNLMRPFDAFTNPPPDLTADQGFTMRWSRLLFSC